MPQPHGIDGKRAKFLVRFDQEAVLVLLGELPRGADHLVDQGRQVHGFGVELELAGFDLREVEHLVDEAEKVGAGAMHAAQRLGRLVRAETRRIGDHHLGQTDDGVEGRAQFMAHAGDELRLVLTRQLELPPFLFDFLEQARVLDRQYRLGGEGAQEVDGALGKFARRLAPHY